MPAYGAWDPSRVVFFSFALFFAMILSDAGYALVLGVLLAVFWPRLGRSETGLRWRQLCTVLVGGSLVWGVLVGSYFGVALSPDGFWGHLKLLDLNDFDTMTKLSVSIGVLHLVLAHLEQLVAEAGPARGLGARRLDRGDAGRFRDVDRWRGGRATLG